MKKYTKLTSDSGDEKKTGFQKLQDLKEPVEGKYEECSTSKMGSNVYVINSHNGLVKIFGFKQLDELMSQVEIGDTVRIKHAGTQDIGNGQIKHFAEVELITDEVEEESVPNLTLHTQVNTASPIRSSEDVLRQFGIPTPIRPEQFINKKENN